MNEKLYDAVADVGRCTWMNQNEHLEHVKALVSKGADSTWIHPQYSKTCLDHMFQYQLPSWNDGAEKSTSYIKVSPGVLVELIKVMLEGAKNQELIDIAWDTFWHYGNMNDYCGTQDYFNSLEQIHECILVKCSGEIHVRDFWSVLGPSRYSSMQLNVLEITVSLGGYQSDVDYIIEDNERKTAIARGAVKLNDSFETTKKVFLEESIFEESEIHLILEFCFGLWFPDFDEWIMLLG